MTKSEVAVVLGIGAIVGVLLYKTGRFPGIQADPIPEYKKWFVRTDVDGNNGLMNMNDPLYMYGDPETIFERHSTDDVGGTLYYRQRPVSQRGAGNPRTDMERAMAHYGINREQYMACPECYPLPERGARLAITRCHGRSRR